MIVVQVLFPQAPVSPEEATAQAERSAPNFRNRPGLLSKHYLREPETGLGGGVYVWESRAQAEAYFTAEWRARMAATVGAEPQVRYFEVPLVVDNTRAAV
jgi:heme-degrading monooxygenase HmoA